MTQCSPEFVIDTNNSFVPKYKGAPGLADQVVGNFLNAEAQSRRERALAQNFFLFLPFYLTEDQLMKILFRGLLLFFAFVIALSIVKYLFFKVFFFALWVAAIVFLIWIVSTALKRA